ncbi:MAG: hypothetical protein GXN95_05860 [Methanococci archaeon]|uniref:Multiple resistance and pH regulation protein F n=1 Tax=Methanocaldococcus vulcanius (strain ATCC 700851 / DSM 12094 / M7) TaxID=579137 RepID=C9REU7_METVM|nr:hypothetical protein [Methanocaldococcus vulcanius]ACX72099.1 conserved hypothetical protein [Methanocaldococcus vulcanius M7]NPA63058.1 hypothetical protein [Methanococci archaeon]
MNFYVWLFAIVALGFSALVGLRLSFKKGTANVLVGESIITVVAGTLIVVISQKYNIAFANTIALAMFICGIVGAFAFCKVIGGDNEKSKAKQPN